ncbi:aminotransferase class IV [Labilibacter marinus]|uniref:aminotransferase class IV n=1 Tax=Labilibacter marinus TaxID=1477105 RepID=UPI000833336D|nr:aminotransferase class IV [Labilibacter marinus]
MRVIIGKAPSTKTIHSKKEIYDIIRIESGIPLFIHAHFSRILSGLTSFNEQAIFKHEILLKGIYQLISDEKICNKNIKISHFINDDEYRFFIFSINSNYPSIKMYQEGIETALLHAERNLPNIKVAHTKVRESANAKIKSQNIFETLLVNHLSEITEGSRSNVFFIKGRQIITAPDHAVLQGIIRGKTIEVINKKGFSLVYACTKASELAAIDAAFITGTSLRILPIKNIDSFTFDVKHPILIELTEGLNRLIEDYKKNADTH